MLRGAGGRLPGANWTRRGWFREVRGEGLSERSDTSVIVYSVIVFWALDVILSVVLCYAILLLQGT